MDSKESLEEKINFAGDVISLANQTAYKDIFLISNPVLSKDYFNNNFLKRFLNNENINPPAFYIVIYKLFIYYLKSLFHFIAYLIRFIEFSWSGIRFYPNKNAKELILIDTFFLIEKIRQEDSFDDPYFLGMEEVLKKLNKHYAYLPFFCSHSHNQRPFELVGILKILEKNKVPILSEYQLLLICDLLNLFYFILTYPFHILSFSRTLCTDSFATRLLKYELLDTLGQVTFYNFSRYLAGKKITRLPYASIKLISWFENQPLQKNLYKGLKANAAKVIIYGAQFFLHSQKHLFLIADENEEKFGVLPDKVIVNGPYFIPKKSRLNYIVGPSLRYAKIFTSDIKRKKQKDILVLLPYFKEELENILSIVINSRMRPYNILIKPHPATPIGRYRGLMLPNVTIKKEDTYKLFTNAKVVVGNASGTLIEAATIGIPIICIRGNKRFDYNNPLPEYGKGIIWEEVDSTDDLIQQIERFAKSCVNNSEEINIIANRYKEMFFCEPTEDSIIKTFDLLS